MAEAPDWAKAPAAAPAWASSPAPAPAPVTNTGSGSDLIPQGYAPPVKEEAAPMVTPAEAMMGPLGLVKAGGRAAGRGLETLLNTDVNLPVLGRGNLGQVLQGVGPPESFGSRAATPIEGVTTMKPRIPNVAKEAPVAPKAGDGRGAEDVISHLQNIRDYIEKKIGKKVAGAEFKSESKVHQSENEGRLLVQSAQQRLERERMAPSGEPTASAGEFGATTQAAANIRMKELEGLRDAERQQLFSALESGSKVNVSGIPKQIDLMLKDEKNTDVVNALNRAKKTLYAREAGTASHDDMLAQLRSLQPGSKEYRELAAKIQAPVKGGPELDSSMKGLDSARNAIKAMMSDAGDPASKFASKQLGQIVKMLEGEMSKASPEYGNFLKKWAEKSAPLDPFKSGATGAAVAKQDFGGGFATTPEALGNKFFRPGDQGAAGIRELKNAVGENPEVMQSMGAYIQGKLKDIPPDKWGTFIKRYEPALKDLGVYEKLKSYEQRAVQAKGGVETAEQSAKKGVEAATGVSKDILGRAKKTQQNVRAGLGESPLGSLTSDFSGHVLPKGKDAQIALSNVFSGNEPGKGVKQLVSMTKGTQEPRAGLRSSYIEWLGSNGDSTANQLQKNWNATREAVRDGGLLAPEHIANIDKAVAEISEAQNAESGTLKKAWASTAGFLAGGLVGHPIVGAHAARDLATGATKSQRVGKALEKALMAIAGEPEGAKALAAAPTPANVEKVRFMLPTDIAAALAPVVAREDSARKRRDPLSMQPSF